MPDRFKIAEIRAVHGIRGEVKLACFLENPDDITRYAPLVDSKGTVYNPIITGHAKDLLIVKLEGIGDRNGAEKLRGLALFADAAKRPATSEDEYYHEDLIGLIAITADGTKVGKVSAIHNFGAGDILEIQGDEEIMLPFTGTFVGDIKDGKMTVTLPEYMGEKES